MKRYILIIGFLGAIITCQAQVINEAPKPYGPQPEVGKPMPDFSLDHITHYRTSKASLRDFKGKWLFLEFWFPGCTTCIKKFPKTNQLQALFSDSVQFLLIGLNNQKYGGTENLYERLRKKQNLNLTVAYDSVLHVAWDIWAMPHIIVIDPAGIVRSITDGRDMTSDKIRDLINGNEASFYSVHVNKPEFESGQLSDQDSSNKSNQSVLYSAILTKWNGERMLLGDINLFIAWPVQIQENGFKSIAVPLAELYKQAYVGQGSWSLFTALYTKRIVKESGMKYWDDSPALYQQFYPNLVLEIKDSSNFHYNVINNTGFYNYRLIVPISKISKNYLMHLMQRDLKDVFGYDVSIESREMPVWKLVVIPGVGKKNATKGGEKFITPGSIAAGFTVRNFPIDQFLNRLIVYVRDNQPPFFDETGIKYNIDLTMDTDLTNFEEIRKSLREKGLDLVKGKKKMKCIVIRDAKK